MMTSKASLGEVWPLWEHPSMPQKRNTAKLHHYVPQGYLRGFAAEHERVTAVPLDRARGPFTTSVKNVAARTHFDTVEGLTEPDEFEKVLSGVEGDAMMIIRRLEEGEFPLASEDRSALSFYLALQTVRGGANDSDFVVLDERDLMLGIVTFAIQSVGVGRSRRTADLQDASLAPVADLSARRDR
ncbi:DUF4238 domain-containing protein [Salinibacterium sp. SWN248]|uniref:DUF4238 domain-containing protein n=1 Tax=Salinibacterium sp. SWN248 TaxID=2792056 RepID=UPI0018CCBB6C|nr:DUF4238 domain-containing protein [Salinibacterium sp. SWN248]MBH0024421.1 DUF4238 domain-containing protein [Salinibacterium sp. SWN248]